MARDRNNILLTQHPGVRNPLIPGEFVWAGNAATGAAFIEVLGGATAGGGRISTAFSYGDPMPKPIQWVEADQRILGIEIFISEAFNVSGTLTCGDSGDNLRLFGASRIDLTSVGAYSCTNVHAYSVDTLVNAYLIPGFGTSQGKGVITLILET